MPYIDLDSGTVLNGPITYVDNWDVFPDDFTDDEAREIGNQHGTPLAVQGDPYILVHGGIVQNSPGLPVFDLDVLEVEAETVGEDLKAQGRTLLLIEEIQEIIKEMSAFPALASEVQRCKSRIAELANEA